MTFDPRTLGKDRELLRWFEAFSNGNLSEAGLEKLNARLANDPAALDEFVIYLDLHARLRRWAVRSSHTHTPSSQGANSGRGGVDINANSQSASLPPGVQITPLVPPTSTHSDSPSGPGAEGGVAYFGARSWSLGLVLGVVLLGVGVWWGAHRLGHDHPQGAGPAMAHRVEDVEAVPVAHKHDYVARIVKASSNCQWGELNSPIEFLVRVGAGDRIHILDGLLELEFYSGARVILHGPAVFTPTGIAAGNLESGRLTGEVSRGDFHLMTPAAEVIDLGTSFGVAADAALGTDVVVFDGRVKVVSLVDNGRTAEARDMTEGMSARFRIDGTTEEGLAAATNLFVRHFPASSARTSSHEICLIDVIAGGNGLGSGLAGAIDPASGQRDYGKEGRHLPVWEREAQKVFHPVAWHSMIDGVFIPTPTGRQVRIDSEGGQFDLPANLGRTYGSLWARRRESVQSNFQPDNDFWGGRTLKGIVNRLLELENGMIGMHANAGITLDLQRMQVVHQRPPLEFRAAVANIENSSDWLPEEMPEYKRTVNFHVLVDGKLRYERLAFRLEDGPEEIVIPLSVDDRFLTLVSTDDGNLEFDHVVLVDPVITLAK